ncbi:ADR229Cp [Eremothecium gossypii ATCC 10895]|uniref:ADR229Cp n=1 Tax=Eremothecium gossypii (strain ATCC 10895 / CBS 109.51 / FGSC 9923 / NRRL Y-1056) TaxID=284811 RepID=Q75A04_EREGS|nr:ADR229Cp [Eremothecium gossypii ATCC 10895]AAS52149.1 ADR229Cp [Eremothecium gossypii ATCC 10895]AEY96448.1 FADR229Cp [Eremothecium gossypii FDAG1]
MLELIGALIVALLIFFSTLIIGCIPIYLLDKRAQRTQGLPSSIATFGVGTLLGTALLLVIPEGIEVCDADDNYGLDLIIGYLVMYFMEKLVNWKGATRPIWTQRESIEHMRNWSDLTNMRKVAIVLCKSEFALAMILHGFSDGAVIGASVSGSLLNWALAAAMLIHKIPTVLSIVSLMQCKQGLNQYEVASNLLLFSASTPIGYLLFKLFYALAFGPTSWLGRNIMLISGGSLLYVATAALQTPGHASSTPTYLPLESAQSVPLSELELGEARSYSWPSTGSNGESSRPYIGTISFLSGLLIPAGISFIH